MNGELTQLATAIGALQRYPVWNTSTDDSVALVAAAQIAITQLTALQAVHARELVGRDYPAQQGATSLTVWLRDRTRISVYSARRLVKLGEYLDAREPVAEAMASGAVTVEQAEVIRDAIADLPRDLDPGIRVDCETALIGRAGVLEPAALRVIGERILAHVAPEVAEAALLAKLQRDEDNAHKARGFTMTPQGHGIVRISGSLDSESAAIIRAAIEPLCKPIAAGTFDRATAADSGNSGNHRNLSADPGRLPTTGLAGSSLSGSGAPATGALWSARPSTACPRWDYPAPAYPRPTWPRPADPVLSYPTPMGMTPTQPKTATLRVSSATRAAPPAAAPTPWSTSAPSPSPPATSPPTAAPDPS